MYIAYIATGEEGENVEDDTSGAQNSTDPTVSIREYL